MTDEKLGSVKSSSEIQLLSANNLLSGQVVYLTPSKQWTRNLDDALRIDQPDTAKELLSEIDADQSVVLSAIIVDAKEHENGTLSLVHFRNQFRESGPTHRVYSNNSSL